MATSVTSNVSIMMGNIFEVDSPLTFDGEWHIILWFAVPNGSAAQRWGSYMLPRKVPQHISNNRTNHVLRICIDISQSLSSFSCSVCCGPRIATIGQPLVRSLVQQYCLRNVQAVQICQICLIHKIGLLWHLVPVIIGLFGEQFYHQRY